MVATVLSQAKVLDKPQGLQRLQSHLWPFDTMTVDPLLEMGLLPTFAYSTAM